VARLQLVSEADVPLHLLADRLREVGHWVPPEALEQAIDAAIAAGPPALLAAVRDRLRDLGSEDSPEEAAMFAGMLEVFVDRGPAALARIETAADACDGVAAATAARRLGRQAEALGVVPLARLCGDVAARAEDGVVDLLPATRAALRRELAVSCRVLAGLAAELTERSRDAVPV
jgi:hypothetical protein